MAKTLWGLVASACVALSFQSVEAADDAMTVATTLARTYEQAVATRDAAAVADSFWPEGVFQNGAGVFIGQYPAAGFRAGVLREDVVVSEAHLVGALLYDRGEFTLYIAAAGSEPQQVKGRFAGVVLRRGNEWKLVQLTAFVPPPPAKP